MVDEYARTSAAAGGFDRAEAHMSRTSIEIDAKGWEQLNQACLKFVQQVEKIEQASKERQDRKPHEEPVGLAAVVLMAFEAARLSGDEPERATKGAGRKPPKRKASADPLMRRPVPIVGAPLAGGPSTPALAAAVSGAGGLGFLGAGYKTAGGDGADIAATRELTREPFGVNVFAVTPSEAPDAALKAFAAGLAGLGAEPGTPHSDDDRLRRRRSSGSSPTPSPVVSFTFGCPAAELLARLREAGSEVWVTVTDPAEAVAAAEAGADALVVQGIEAGGHRGAFADERPGDYGLLALLQLVGDAVPLPLVATGGIATGRAVAAVLAAGATAAAIGTALMGTPEAGTNEAHRRALARPGRTAVTRAFTGRSARGIVNRFMREHGEAAPAAYPGVHHITAPIRAQARADGDPELLNLWAGQAHELLRELPAAELVRALHEEAIEALASAAARASR